MRCEILSVININHQITVAILVAGGEEGETRDLVSQYIVAWCGGAVPAGLPLLSLELLPSMLWLVCCSTNRKSLHNKPVIDKFVTLVSFRTVLEVTTNHQAI